MYIPPSKKFKNLKIHCNHKACATLVNEICKLTGGHLKNCPHPHLHKFKCLVYTPGEKLRKTKILETLDYNEAIRQTIEFQKEVRENGIALREEKRIITEFPKQETRQHFNNEPEKSFSLSELLARYVGYLHGDENIVRSFRRKIRGKKYLAEVERILKYFAVALKKNNYPIQSLRVDEVSEMMIEKFHDYLRNDLKLSNNSYNKALTILTCFYNYLEDEGYHIRIPFKSIPRKIVTNKPQIISQSEYEQLLAIVQKPELGISTLSTGEKKDLYKPWIKDSIELGLHTGRRNEEIASMKWSDIYEDEKGNACYIKVQDFKVNRQRGNIEEENIKWIYVPVTSELLDVLNRMQYEFYRGTDKYILAPEEDMTRDTIKLLMTRCFTHYYNQLKTGKKLTYKSLRKTYISQLSNFMGIENARLITRHSGTQVMTDHYIDQKYISRTAQGFKLFDHAKENRQQEIDNARTDKKRFTIER